MDKSIATMILAWIEINLEGTDNPSVKGKRLSHDRKGVCQYRIGQYRLLAHIAGETIRKYLSK